MKNPWTIGASSVKAALAILNRIEQASQRIRANIEEGVIGLSDEDHRLLTKNDELLGRHSGKPCFVIGNGPSLNQQDLRPLKDAITLAMSGFWKHPIVREWQPTYYCFADPVFFDGSEAMKRFFVDMFRRVKFTNYIVPMEGRRTVQTQALLEDAPTYYIHFRGSLDRSFSRRVNLASSVPRAQSVSQLAIMCAIYMGCSPIYLIGLDHDWLAKRGAETHFYEGRTIQGHPVADGNLDKVPYRLDLESSLKLWKGYERLKIMAVNHQCEIVNATHGGFLDVFPRTPYEQALKIALNCSGL